MRVLKWQVPVDDNEHQIGGGIVMLVASQYGDPAMVQVWTTEDGSDPNRIVRVFGTGQDVPEGSWWPIGSAMMANGQLVWHIFERSEPFPGTLRAELEVIELPVEKQVQP